MLQYMTAKVGMLTAFAVTEKEFLREPGVESGGKAETVAVSLKEKSYKIYIAEGAIAQLAACVSAADRWFILTDHNLDRLYGEHIDAAFHGQSHVKLAVPPGESAKTLRSAETILAAMLDARLTRHSVMVAFGGGVIGDLAGFCASIYMRGIRYVQVPTSLLAQVDSSVGGKTGVNMRQGKNMVGTFYQPQVVLIDPETLATLPERDFTAGLSEAVKYGIICDYQLLEFISENFTRICAREVTVLKQLIKRCCQLKAAIVGQDETESGLRRILNFGHTVGHALETLTQYERYLHGEAVLIGMYHESLMARRLNLISDDYWQKIKGVLKRAGISSEMPEIKLSDLVAQMTADKKNHDNTITFILPVGLGRAAEFTLTPEQTLVLLSGAYY
ncbi:MAG: 3-dehydroquinate synthase [Negativicutes bacterium]|nr:3-dehydroquinate synthase [Negativicutes bacterium]